MKPDNTRCYPKRRWWLGIGMLLFAISAWQFGTAAYIHAKAELAQWLLADAWQKIKQGEPKARPWPWADTWPVARLRVPRLDIDQLVLAGASGRTLAFGPGWMASSARPGEQGMSIIAAHRDTHFNFLQYLRPGDLLYIEGEHGRSVYQVTTSQVADSRHQRIQPTASDDQLVLITCYPFTAIVPGGPLRFVVFASKKHLSTGKKTLTRTG
jgi:sortase A